MAFLQSLDENQFKTFDDLACTALLKICMLLTGSLKTASVTLVDCVSPHPPWSQTPSCEEKLFSFQSKKLAAYDTGIALILPK